MSVLQRRFLLVLAAWVLWGLSAEASSYYTILHGKVADRTGRPLVNVPVTDGNQITVTDSKGQYILHSTRDQRFVYITLPAGYEIPYEQGLPRFYQQVNHAVDSFAYDFVLHKLAQDDADHRVVVWADPQINNEAQAAKLIDNVVPDLQAHLKGSNMPTFGICVGDLIWDNPGILPKYKEALSLTGIPFFQVLGNHDMDHARSDERSAETFHQHFGPSWYSFNRGKVHYVVLDNVFYYGDGYNYVGYITEQQLTWLERDLNLVPAGSTVIVSMHIPAYTDEKNRNGRATHNPGNVTNNRKYLYELLAPYQAHIFTGHTHYQENQITEGVFEHIHASVGGAWWSSAICSDGTPAGYMVYEASGDSVSWYYKSVGHAVDHQFRMYQMADFDPKDERLLVNVWNWDPEWEVIWYQGGKIGGDMVRYIGVDPLAKAVMTDPENPLPYTWIRPTVTGHLFEATPKLGAGDVHVEVKDRFGRVYKQVLPWK